MKNYTPQYYKVAAHTEGLYYARGAKVVFPVEKLLHKTKAVLTESGAVLIRDHVSSLSIEEILEIYGGKIIDIEVMSSDDRNSFYITNENFPKIKNRKALDRVYLKYRNKR